MEAIKEDTGDHEQGMQCSDHPYNRNNPGGICAFCLKEKLGKLVSSPSFPLPVRASSSSSPSPSFRSNVTSAASNSVATSGVTSNIGVSSTTSASLAATSTTCYTRKARYPFLLLAKKKKMVVVSTSRSDLDMVLKRSKSTTTPRRSHFMDGVDISPRTKKNGFWSFFYLLSSTKSTTTTTKTTPTTTRPTTTSTTAAAAASSSYGPTMKSNEKCLRGNNNNIVVVKEGEDSVMNVQATERKMSRSRSVGCGSRSFSGDFFERISSGCGDCTSLRRVESQREGKASKVHSNGATTNNTNTNIKERVKCGGIFGGFTINSSSSSSFSSSSSSSSYWVSSLGEDGNNGKLSRAGGTVHSRNRNWSWSFASPMRAFGKQSSKDGNNKSNKVIRESSTSNKNTTPNLSAIPSLLAVRS